MTGKSEVQERINVFTKPAIQNRPVMFTHQTPEPRYLFDPPRSLSTPSRSDDPPTAATADTGPGSTHPLPTQQRAASSTTEDQGRGHAVRPQERGGDGEAAPSVYGPSAAAPELRRGFRPGPLRSLSVTASGSGKMADTAAAAAAAAAAASAASSARGLPAPLRRGRGGGDGAPAAILLVGCHPLLLPLQRLQDRHLEAERGTESPSFFTKDAFHNSPKVMMAGNLTIDQRKWILKQYWKTENAEKVRQKWAEEFDTPSPSRQTIYRIRDKFDETGSICNAPKSGRPVSITTQENEMLVSQAFTDSPKKSKQRASVELGISCRSLSRIMQRLGLKMYRPRLLHGLLEDDPDRRLQFCEVVLNEERQGNGIIDKITWSDEAHFKLSGAVNRHNCVYYSRENPHVMIEGQLNQPGITVWAGLSCKGVLGPIFFHTTVTHDLYLDMLRGTVLPQLQRQHDNDDFFFQQDEALPHCAVTVREFLDEQLPNRWIGRRGPVEWPPRSPDLTPMDFFFWGVVRDKVFSRKPHTMDDMIRCIREACQEIDDNKELCVKVCSNIASRLQECVNNEGRQFEHIRDYT